MCRARVELMWSIIAASVVDFPGPGRPREQHDSARLLGELANHRRQAEVGDRSHLEWDRPERDRHGRAAGTR